MTGIEPALAIFGLPHGSEIWIIALVAILLFGAKRLPELARSVGKSISQFKSGLKEAGNDNEPKADPPPPATRGPEITEDRKSEIDAGS